jgi:type IV secretion/conjugal transfer VirB4 family ATPase
MYFHEPKDRMSDQLPWLAAIAPGVVLQKDGILLRSYSFRGPDLAASAAGELVSAAGRANNALKRLGSGWSLFIEAARRSAKPYPRSTWPTPASAIIDAERRRSYERAGALHESQYYLSLGWRTPTERVKRLTSFFYDDPQPAPETDRITRDLDYFNKTCVETADILRGVFAELAELDSDQQATYLKSTISLEEQSVRLPECPINLDCFLPDQAFVPGETPLLGEHYLTLFTVRGFPSSTFVGMLDALNGLRFPYRWMTRFICLDREEAKAKISTMQRHWFAQTHSLRSHIGQVFTGEKSKLQNPTAGLRAEEATCALRELGDDTAAFGYCTATLVSWNRDRREAIEQARQMKKILHARDLITIDESVNSLEAWVGSLPGAVHANVRRPMVHTHNLMHILPMSAVWAGDQENQQLKRKTGVGTSHVYCAAGSNPFRLNLGVGDVGNALILGPPGAGKSSLLALLAMQWLRYPEARVIIYDRDRSARAATLANASVSGFVQYFEPGNPKAPLVCQPLRDIHDVGERGWAARFIQLLLTLQGVKITKDVQAPIDEALLHVAERDRASRTMTIFAAMLGSYDLALAEALRPYTKAGIYGQIFDAGAVSDAVMTYARWRMYEMGQLMQLGDAAIVPAIEYLDHRDRATYDGTPLLKIYDECWLFMGHPVFANMLRRDLKTLRKKNVSIVFATQEVADAAARPDLLSTILQACQTKIFLADASASSPSAAAAYQTFGLSPHEIGVIATAQPKRDYFYHSTKGRRLFSLELGPAALAVVGVSDESDQRAMDAIVQTREPKDYAAALFERRNVHWAVKTMNAQTRAAARREQSDEADETSEHAAHSKPSEVSVSP